MKSSYPITLAVTVGSSIGLVAALGYCMATTAPDPAPATAKLGHHLIVDRSPPERVGPLGGFATIVDKASPSVVSILATKVVESVAMPNLPPGMFGLPGRSAPFQNPAPRQEGQGSGVILSADGIILTNNHVVEGATEVKVALNEGDALLSAEIVGRDPMTDLAILRIDASNLPAATLGDSDSLRPGDTVLAIGNPFGLTKTVTSGIVSAVGRNNVGIVGYENYIQTDASINPGNSGGALVDNKGRVIGINTAILSRTGGNVGIGFAIPINMAVNIADQLIDHGTIQRGYLGVMLGRLTPELAKALQVEGDGALVNDVLPDTPAAKAGFEPGDVILRVNDKSVADVASLRLQVSNVRPGEHTKFTVRRDDRTLELDAVIGSLPSNLAARSPEDSENSAQAVFLDGVSIETLTDTLRQQLNVAGEVSGVVITRVDPQSKAARAGLEPGDVITEVARTPVASVREAMNVKRKVSNRMLLLRVATAEGSRFVAVEIG